MAHPNGRPAIDWGINPIATKHEAIGNLRVELISLKAAVEILPQKTLSPERMKEAQRHLAEALRILRSV